MKCGSGDPLPGIELKDREAGNEKGEEWCRMKSDEMGVMDVVGKLPHKDPSDERRGKVGNCAFPTGTNCPTPGWKTRGVGIVLPFHV